MKNGKPDPHFDAVSERRDALPPLFNFDVSLFIFHFAFPLPPPLRGRVEVAIDLLEAQRAGLGEDLRGQAGEREHRLDAAGFIPRPPRRDGRSGNRAGSPAVRPVMAVAANRAARKRQWACSAALRAMVRVFFGGIGMHARSVDSAAGTMRIGEPLAARLFRRGTLGWSALYPE